MVSLIGVSIIIFLSLFHIPSVISMFFSYTLLESQEDSRNKITGNRTVVNLNFCILILTFIIAGPVLNHVSKSKRLFKIYYNKLLYLHFTPKSPKGELNSAQFPSGYLRVAKGNIKFKQPLSIG